MKKKVRTRFAPSPTGFLHIGSLRTALYSYALAKHFGGDFYLRIEDTDQKRKVEGADIALQEILKKFKLFWDGPLYIQSKRKEEGIYQKKAEELVKKGKAFFCNCPARNAKEEGFTRILRDPCRSKNFSSGAIKLMVPDNKIVSYYDFVHKKEISWNTKDVYDATLLKSDGFPTYHLAVCVDDLDMGITHILRGHDWLPSTPIHLLVFEYLQGERPEIGHLTDILSAETGKKLSKRKDSVFVEQFLEEGYLPEALLNFVMLLGWAPKDNREFFTLEEFVENFDINGFQEANPKFLKDKLLWMNGVYISKLSDKEFAEKVKKYAPFCTSIKDLEITAPLVKTRIKKLSDFRNIALPLFENPKSPDDNLLIKVNKVHLRKALEVLEKLNDKEWKSKLDDILLKLVSDSGFKTGDFFMSLRIAIFSSDVTPPINESMKFIGKKNSLLRIKRILNL